MVRSEQGEKEELQRIKDWKATRQESDEISEETGFRDLAKFIENRDKFSNELQYN